jgi:energy-coupling factor transporter ATP-binding protein EcfA2
MVKLKRLKIEKYRNVKPGTELHFRDSLNVMLGRNGTGKTTLLNLIVQLLSWDFSQLQNEAVDLEYVLEAPEVELLVRLCTDVVRNGESIANSGRQLPDEMLAMGLLQQNPRYTTILEVEILRQDARAYQLRLEGALLTVSKKGESPLYTMNSTQPLLTERTLLELISVLGGIFSTTESIRPAVLGLASATAGALHFLRRFDESLDYLGHIVRQGSSVVARRGQHGKTPYFAFSFGGPLSFARRLMDLLNRDSTVDEIRIESKDAESGFLARLVELLGFESAHVRLQRTSRLAGPGEQVEFGNIQFNFIRRDGSITNHSLLSYGQKRLLAFYYYLASNLGCVVADELVNGMHHEWIEACLEDLGERQAFLTSQNPLLLDYLSFESAKEVRDSFVLCRTELHEGREQMVWENMTEEDADGFFKAYRVAIQHVSELLRTRGLW